MVKFLYKVCVFLLPVVCVYVFPTGVLILAREYYTARMAVRAQTEEPKTLFSMSYASSYAPYKAVLVEERQPTIIAAGASRALPFREMFFTTPERFTNAGLPGASLDEVKASLEAMVRNNPGIRVVILSLDPEDFDPTFIHQPESAANLKAWYRSGWKDAYETYAAGGYTLAQLRAAARTTQNIGLPALVHQDGMRSDGSYQYHKILSDPGHDTEIDRQIAELVEKINTQRKIHFGRSISPEALEMLNELLATCKAHQVYVVGFLPPFPQPMYSAMVSKDDAYSNTVKALPRELERIFNEQGFSFYNFTDSTIVHAGVHEYTDAGHGSDTLYARIGIYLATHDQILAQYIDAAALRQLLKEHPGSSL